MLETICRYVASGQWEAEARLVKRQNQLLQCHWPQQRHMKLVDTELMKVLDTNRHRQWCETGRRAVS